jgi:hypothetical protein
MKALLAVGLQVEDDGLAPDFGHSKRATLYARAGYGEARVTEGKQPATEVPLQAQCEGHLTHVPLRPK